VAGRFLSVQDRSRIWVKKEVRRVRIERNFLNDFLIDISKVDGLGWQEGSQARRMVRGELFK
jgi:poly-gamma-glutamate capsule biosynthesis protein CapA/YwtB (metallophosphatase superfamily)